MSDEQRRRKRPEAWPVTFKAASDANLDDSLAATPAERLAWLEEALELAAQAKRHERE